MQYELQDLKNHFRVPSKFNPSDYKFKQITTVSSLRTGVQLCCFICRESSKDKTEFVSVRNGSELDNVIIACSNPQCRLIAKVSKAIDESYFKVLKSPEKFHTQYYTVERSNGDIENDWFITQIALRDNRLNFQVQKMNDTTTKWVPAEQFIVLNRKSLKKNVPNLSEQLESSFCDFYPIKQYETFTGALKGFEQQLKLV